MVGRIYQLSAAFILSCLITGCLHVDQEVQKPYSTRQMPGLSIEVTEQAHDGKYLVRPDEIERVDANSTLIVNFSMPATVGALHEMPSAQWQRVTSLLRETEDLTKSRALLNSMEVDLNNREQVDQLKQKAKEEDQKIIVLYSKLENMGLDQKTIRSILTGTFDGLGTRSEPYVNLARWLRKEIERLEQEALDFARTREKVRVTVQALHEPVIGTIKYLHIEGYDSLPEGEYRPIDRYGLNLTDAERQRFKVEFQQTKLVADSIRETSAKGKNVKEAVRKWLVDVEANINGLEISLRNEPSGWLEASNHLIAKLEASLNASGTSSSDKVVAKEAIEDLKAFQHDTKSIRHLVSTVENFYTFLRGVKGLPFEAFVDLNRITTQLQAFNVELQRVLQLSRNWKTRLENVRTSLNNLGGIVSAEEVKQMIDQPFRDFLTTVTKDLPKSVEAINTVLDIVKVNVNIAKGAAILSETDQKAIPRTLDNLIPARIELPQAGLTLGDYVRLKVKVLPASPDGGPTDSLLENVNYRTEAVLTGLHRRIGADLIFARGYGSDDARKWRPNVAARAEWHYLFRDPKSWQTFWNWLDPGFGLHAASLNQGPESIQAGLGGNISLWNNFLSFGYGHNLSTDRQYVFIGINLLNVLNKAKVALGE